jgi:splicing factor U2AF subunit
MTPTVSQSILLPNLYQSPKWAAMAAEGGVNTVTDTEEKEHLEEFYLEMFEELAKFGDIEQIYLCENSCDHLIGNVYVSLFPNFPFSLINYSGQILRRYRCF